MSDFIPAINPTQDRWCQLCSHAAAEEHHLQHRSMGGTDHAHNLVLLCRPCHDHCHPEKNGGVGWEIALTPDARYVLEDGKVISVRWTPPPDFDEGRFVADLDAATPDLERRAAWFRWLSDDGLVAAGEALYRLHYTGWVVRARLFETAVLRTPYGSKSAKLKELAKLFSIGGSQAWSEVAALEVLDAHAELFQHVGQVPSPDLLVLAGKQPDPVQALELLVDRRSANPHYSRITYAAEIKAGRTSHDAPPQRTTCVCNCGHVHWRDADGLQDGERGRK